MASLRKIANRLREVYGKSQQAGLSFLVYDLFEVVFELIRGEREGGVALKM